MDRFYIFWYYESLTELQQEWAKLIALYIDDINSALEDPSVGYDVNGYVKKASDLTCGALYSWGLDESAITKEICSWLLSIITDPKCYLDEWEN